MTFSKLMDALSERAVRIQRDGGDLIILGEEETLDPSLLSELIAHKAELLNLVNRNNGDWLSPGFIITPEMLPLAQLSAVEIEQILDTVPGGAANVQDIYPLAPLQEGILFHHLVGSEGDPYLLHNLYSFDTRDQLDGFLQSLQKVIDRHDILRTAVVWEGLREPMQVVWRRAAVAVEEVDIDPATGETAEQLLARFSPRRYRIDVRRAPMMQAHVAHDAREGRWVMLLLFHHLLGDHAALEGLRTEVRAHLLGQADRLPAPTPFRNFVAQARLGVSQQEHEGFFREMLWDVDEPTAPFGLTDVRGDGSGVREAGREVDAGLASRLRRRARALGVSAASICHLAWALVLAKVSGRDDVVFGTVLFGRMRGGENADQAPGLFINTLPIRVRISEENVQESVRRIHTLLARLLRHEHAPLALAQRCSAVTPPTPLFSALLNYRHSAGADTSTIGAEDALTAWEGIEFLGSEERTNYPLILNVDDLGRGIELSAQAQSPVDPDRVCAYMQTALERLVEALEQAPATPARSLDALPASERHQLLVEWNATEVEYPADQCVHTLFEGQAARTPHAVAVAHEDRQLSYGELNARADRLARYLRTLNVRPNARVAIRLERSIELVLAELAILKCGAVYVPLDQDAPAERQAFMIEDCQAEIVLTVKDSEAPESAEVKCVNIDALTLVEDAADSFAAPLESEAPAYIMYTSGSTGRPKGVIIPHRAIGRLALNNHYASFETGDRIAFAANPAFDASTMEVWAPLLNGGCVIVIAQSTLLAPERFKQSLQSQSVNVLWMTVGLFNQYVDILAEVRSQLRYLIVGGEALDAGVIARVLRSSPPQHLVNGYGPTESTTFAVTHEITGVAEGAAGIPIGRPIANTQAYLLDSRYEPVPVGVIGEICIGGAGVAHGYLNRAGLTAERFLVDPYAGEAGARMYRTGDLGRYLSDGTIEFLGRNDQQVKIRGFRIELGEIEARLTQHSAIKEAVALAREDGLGDKWLVAYYTVARTEGDGSTIEAEELRAHLLTALPVYMLPAWFVRLEEMPLTPNGKVDRRALAAIETKSSKARTDYVAPRTAVEEILVGIFENVLNLDRVGIYDNFFEMGGHSLLATRVISRVKSLFDVGIDVRSIFEEATVARLAEVLIAQESKPGQVEKIALILKKLNDMTDEDAGAELAALEQ
jgi:amino acid adenylation domain-containing protein